VKTRPGHEVSVQGSVRVDLVGGTLDIHPLSAVLKNVVTLNMATSLMAKVKIVPINEPGISIHSADYNLTQHFELEDFKDPLAEKFGPLIYVAHLISYFQNKKKLQTVCNFRMEIQSGSPAGAGLGGSSAMGVTVYKALCLFLGFDFDRVTAIKVASFIEAKILDCGPTGYQDYYPAMYGGVLALLPTEEGVEVEQMFRAEIEKPLLSRLTLVYSGQSRLSAINNWEVFKGFFDRKNEMRLGLERLAQTAAKAYSAFKIHDWDLFAELVAQEGQIRMGLFPNIATPKMQELWNGLNRNGKNVGLKVCGAGGGGCFLLVHSSDDKERVHRAIENAGMSVLKLEIMPPLVV
jgi:D-glycero-alpha-D-manno-heptose-7-phosphate kinase